MDDIALKCTLYNLVSVFFFHLFEYSETKREERQIRKRQQSDDVNAILCNSVKMIREKLTVSEGMLLNGSTINAMHCDADP